MDMGNSTELERLLGALGREIRAWRIKRKLTRAELARLADMSEKQVGNIERGERGQMSEALAIALALNVDFAQMVRAAQEEAALEAAREADAG